MCTSVSRMYSDIECSETDAMKSIFDNHYTHKKPTILFYSRMYTTRIKYFARREQLCICHVIICDRLSLAKHYSYEMNKSGFYITFLNKISFPTYDYHYHIVMKICWKINMKATHYLYA